jgi:hypothetical protein
MTTVEIISLAGSLIGLGCGVTALASTIGRGIVIDDLLRRVATIERVIWPIGKRSPFDRGGMTTEEWNRLRGGSINLPHVPDDWKAGDR